MNLKINSMEEEKILDLNISIFYADNMWYKFLNEVVYPFLNNTENLYGYNLMLSYDRGSHIKLVLKTDKPNARIIAHKADIKIKDFLKQNPSSVEVKEVKSNLHSFIDFKNNSVHYGVFNDKLIIFGTFQQDISTTLLQVFKFYKQDTLDNLVEIMIEFLAIFCRSAELEIHESIELFDFMLDKEYKKYNNAALNRILKLNKENFDRNAESVIQYLSIYKTQNPELFKERWQITWSKAVKERYVFLSNFLESFNRQTEHERIINWLYYFFDFKERITVFYLFTNALKSLK